MEPDGSLPPSQEPTNYPYPEPPQSSPCPHIPPVSPVWSFSLKFPHQNFVYAFPLPQMSYVPCPSHSSQFLLPIKYWTSSTIIKLLIM